MLLMEQLKDRNIPLPLGILRSTMKMCAGGLVIAMMMMMMMMMMDDDG